MSDWMEYDAIVNEQRPRMGIKTLLIIGLKIAEIIGVGVFLYGWWMFSSWLAVVIFPDLANKILIRIYVGMSLPAAGLVIFSLIKILLLGVPEWIHANSRLADKILRRTK